jgi:glucose/arabinose dehydrogenase
MKRRALIAAAVAAVLVLAVSAAAAPERRGGFQPVTIVSGLDPLTDVVAPPGSRDLLYVVAQTGLIRTLKNGKLQARPFLDLRRLVKAGGEQGLLGLAFAPDYAKSRFFVVNYTDVNGDTRVVRYRSSGTVGIPASARQLLFVKQPYSNHNGGDVVFGPDGLLYVGMGDGGGGGDPGNRAQNPRSRLGKLLRLDWRKPGAAPKLVALGLRNPWRFSFDRANGDLWIGDVGQERLEEVDHVAWPLKGLLNFGWNAYEGTDSYKQVELGPGKLTQPVEQYTHENGCSITGGFVYRGTAVPSLVGRYVYGDFCAGTVWSLKLVDGKGADERNEPFTIDNLTSFGEDPAGELYAVSGNGTLYRLTS